MTRVTFLSGFLRVTAAFHAGVGAYLVPAAHGRVGLGVAAGVLAFACGAWAEPKMGARAVLARAYVLPVAVTAAVYVGFSLPASWATVTFSAERFCSEVLGRTPNAAYLVAAAYGCFRAQRVEDAASKTTPTYYR